MSHGKQFTLFSHLGGGPNGWKVAIVLDELGLEYEPKYLDFGKDEHRAQSIRSTTRMDGYQRSSIMRIMTSPSAAIIAYLVDKYDPEHKVSVGDPSEKWQQLQWLIFQASGQGPYFGQAYWFMKYHHEIIPSAIDRYRKETVRVLGVLEKVLSKQEWLVGGKCTVADLSFVPWNVVALDIMRQWNVVDFKVILAEYPGFDLEKTIQPSTGQLYYLREAS
ncbi:glutathione S-transferase [Fomitopsis serialis]|uniref:glutathione S-transferase n=1 Tax=Fomitopsis serialis TaxID=139415 RepID=UPI0020075544|nr:glutathione S-transferase [Neoantrodia serialis]KAH9919700.1 glutathione S-transferase [Neoantrodia serialis]